MTSHIVDVDDRGARVHWPQRLQTRRVNFG